MVKILDVILITEIILSENYFVILVHAEITIKEDS